MGIKLMTYFDDDPSKPMRVEVNGSPFYSVYFREQSNLELDPFSLASVREEGWHTGWCYKVIYKQDTM
jgi:hypothetical protein